MYIKIYSIICMLWGYLSPGLGPIPIPNFSILHAENRGKICSIEKLEAINEPGLEMRLPTLHYFNTIVYSFFFPTI